MLKDDFDGWNDWTCSDVQKAFVYSNTDLLWVWHSLACDIDIPKRCGDDDDGQHLWMLCVP